MVTTSLTSKCKGCEMILRAHRESGTVVDACIYRFLTEMAEFSVNFMLI